MEDGTAKKICLFGPQGSGKGTQAEKLSEYLGTPHLAPGNMFRKAVADGTELGKQVEAIINEGKLVPDEVTNAVIKRYLEQPDALNGFILDGYPRNVAQADALDSFTPLTHVLLIDITDEESVRRISQRRTCGNCGITYHLEYKKPAVEGQCDTCGQKLVQRDDDTPEAIQKRLKIYHSQTKPLLERYEERGILQRVDGSASIPDVWDAVKVIIDA